MQVAGRHDGVRPTSVPAATKVDAPDAILQDLPLEIKTFVLAQGVGSDSDFAVIWGGFGEAAAKYWRWETFGTAFDPPIPATNKPLVLITLFVLALQVVSNLIRDWPLPSLVRKIFDVSVVALLLALAWYAYPAIFADAESGSKVPTGWRIGMGVAMVFALGMALLGLVRDFNRTPALLVESHDPADEFDPKRRAEEDISHENFVEDY